MLYDLEKEDLISIIKNSDYGDLEALAREIRDFLVEKVSKTGGHLASNLGIVETTIALHKVYDTAVDRVIFDVGHQSYVHKIITGRAGAFDTLRKYKGLSGFRSPGKAFMMPMTRDTAVRLSVRLWDMPLRGIFGTKIIKWWR